MKFYRFGIGPGFIKAVKFSGFPGKNVNDHTSVIQQNPGSAAPLNVMGENPFFLQLVFHFFRQCPNMRRRGGTAQQETISNDAELLNIQRPELQRFFAFKGLCGTGKNFVRFQSDTSFRIVTGFTAPLFYAHFGHSPRGFPYCKEILPCDKPLSFKEPIAACFVNICKQPDSWLVYFVIRNIHFLT